MIYYTTIIIFENWIKINLKIPCKAAKIYFAKRSIMLKNFCGQNHLIKWGIYT